VESELFVAKNLLDKGERSIFCGVVNELVLELAAVTQIYKLKKKQKNNELSDKPLEATYH